MQRKITQILFIISFGLCSFFTHAQNGYITGTVKDGELNDVLPFAEVTVKETTKGSTTDFEGKYSIEIEPGTYTLVFSFVGYETKEITGV
ncbi:MAG: carboxypeptidase-like regulatory domain-containing protein, partial [Psychroflexus sp.]|nr:carboxypeptidase-like regulatory domain-containing protein [Psychroflexus sp.]MDR9449426.1 carboxypeptidase-like regulatory domain-containing protein [Psychroflexus sp.]